MMKATPENIGCLMCGGDTHYLWHLANEGVGPREEFNVRRCIQCFSTNLDPVPEDLNQFYRGYHTIPKGKSWKRSVRACNNRLDVLNSLGGSINSILDFGAGPGAFVDAAKLSGFTVHAVEPDQVCRSHLELIIPNKVSKSLETFIDASLLIPDIISLWHVFEHIPNPNEFLEIICNNFPRDTRIIIEVPNADSWIFKIMGRRWPHLDVPRHIFLPTAMGMKSLADKNGMTLIQLRNHDSAKWAAFSISHFGSRPGEHRMIQILRRGLQIFLSPFFRLEPLKYSTTSTYLLTIKT
jgi:hypothetical protein